MWRGADATVFSPRGCVGENCKWTANGRGWTRWDQGRLALSGATWADSEQDIRQRNVTPSDALTRPHNPKVGGSNPSPATRFEPERPPFWGPLGVSGDRLQIVANRFRRLSARLRQPNSGPRQRPGRSPGRPRPAAPCDARAGARVEQARGLEVHELLSAAPIDNCTVPRVNRPCQAATECRAPVLRGAAERSSDASRKWGGSSVCSMMPPREAGA
jgi:hypothetical protein